MKYLIAGNIVDTEADRYTPEAVCPAMVSDFIKGLEPNEPIELEVTSYGGSVPAGLAIANMLKMASAEGHKTMAHVIGIAASMASAIACACDTLRIDSNAFLMVHLPYTYSVGNAEEFRKEAETLDKFRDALIAIYRSKFDLSDEAIRKLMEEETWIVGEQAETYKLNAEVIPVAEPLKAAAFAGREMPKWLHIPQTITDLVSAKVEAKAEPKADEPKAEEKINASIDYFGLKNAEVKAEEVKLGDSSADEPAEMITKAEADRRVSGMQSAMAKQIDALRKEYDAKINDFETQLKAKDGELTKAQATVTSLTKSLEDTKRELAETASALAEKNNTLAKLNASVLTPQIGQSDAAKNWRAAYSAIRRN